MSVKVSAPARTASKARSTTPAARGRPRQGDPRQEADYVLALKGNQGSLREDVEVFVAEQKAKGFADTEATRDTTIDGGHGRIETRTTTVIHDVGWLRDRHDWPGLKAVVVVDSSREINGKTAGRRRTQDDT